jgi:hypothetical protein
LQETEKTRLPIYRETIVRASQRYFSAVPDALPTEIPEEQYRFDNGITGWSRQAVSQRQPGNESVFPLVKAVNRKTPFNGYCPYRLFLFAKTVGGIAG